VAVAKMLQNDVGRLPVVHRDDPRQLAGYLGRTGIMEARSRSLKEEHVRERSWQRPRRVMQAQPQAKPPEAG
jgi:hypothetical protein